MTKITKILVVVASSLLMSVASIAGELSVTGSAKASYLVNGGGSNNNDKGLGVSNELTFSASGEMDNGYSWNYHMELDPNGGGTTDNDDSALTINTNGMGTVGIFDSEGGLSTELGWGIGALGTGIDYANTMGAAATNGALNWGYDVSSYPNIQYHLPADVLPFGIGAKVGYAPNTSDGDSNDFKNAGVENTAGVDGDALIQYQLSAAPIDGLKIGADYAAFEGETGASDQEQSGGNYYLQYAIGNFKVGYMNGFTEKAKATYADGDGTSFDSYEYDAMGVEFALNDAVTLSYSSEDHEAKDKGNIAVGSTTRTTKTTTMSADTMQIAYNVGGATIGLFHVDTDNSQFSEGRDESKTIASIAMEF
jgi:outer membrane protein OmpU